jgi:ATP-dependent RNA/DNA helicase IGHMBP2
MNVAITRGRRHVCLVGDSDTCSATPFLARMLRYFEEHGDVRSAAQYGASAAVGGQYGANAKPSAARGRVAPSKDLPNKELLTEAQAEERLRARIQGFLADESQRAHALPPSLNSFERMVAHQMAAQLGLEHVSTGEGRQRFITLYKKGASPPSAHHSASSPSDAPATESAVVSASVSAHEGPPTEQPPTEQPPTEQSPADAETPTSILGKSETPTSIGSDRASGAELEVKPSEAMPAPAALAPHSPPSRHPMDTRQHQLALRVRELFTQLSAAGVGPNEAAVQAMAAAQAEVAQGEAAAPDLSKVAAPDLSAPPPPSPLPPPPNPSLPTKDLPNKELLTAGRPTREPTRAAQAADARAAAARAAAARAAGVQNELSSAAAAAAAAAAAREAALAESNHALREAAVAREARQREVEAERQAAEAAVRLAMRKEEDQRRKELARAKKERRKQQTGDDSGGGGGGAEGDDDDVDAALAALGLAPNGASAAEPMANPTAPSALPWGRDREAERERERLQAALRQKLASGDGSHQKRQPKKK